VGLALGQSLFRQEAIDFQRGERESSKIFARSYCDDYWRTQRSVYCLHYHVLLQQQTGGPIKVGGLGFKFESAVG
jgi:hypothetical protein